MNKEHNGTHTSHNNRYATRLNCQDKEALLDSLRSYHSTHPYSFHKLSSTIGGVSPATLWRIINRKSDRNNNSTLFHVFHFLKENEVYSPIQTQLTNGNWIRFSKRGMPRFY